MEKIEKSSKEIELSIISRSDDSRITYKWTSRVIREFLQGDNNYEDTVRVIKRALDLDATNNPVFLYTEEARNAYNEFLEELYKFVLCESIIDKSSIYDNDNVKRFMRVRVREEINKLENSYMPYDVAMVLTKLDKDDSNIYLDKKLMSTLFLNTDLNISKEQIQKIVDKELESSLKKIEYIDKKIEPTKESISRLKKSMLRISIIAGTIFLSASSWLFLKSKKTSALKYNTQTIYEDLSFSDIESTYENHDNTQPVEKEKRIVTSPVENGVFTESIYNYTNSGISNADLLNKELDDAYLVSRTTHSITEYPEDIMSVYKDISSENRVIISSKTDGKKGIPYDQVALLIIAINALEVIGFGYAANAPFLRSDKKKLKEYEKEKELENNHIVAISMPTFKETKYEDIDTQLEKEKHLEKKLESR